MYKLLVAWLTFSLTTFAAIPTADEINVALGGFVASLLAEARARLEDPAPTFIIDDAHFEHELRRKLEAHFGSDKEMAAPVAKKFRAEARTAMRVRALAEIESIGKTFTANLPAGSVRRVGPLREFPSLKPAEDFLVRKNEGRVDLSGTLVILADPEGSEWHGQTFVPMGESNHREFTLNHSMKYENPKFKIEFTLDVSGTVVIKGALALLQNEFRRIFGTTTFVTLQNAAYLRGGASILGTAVNELCSVADFALRPELFTPEKIRADYEKSELNLAPSLVRSRAEYEALVQTKPYLDHIDALVGQGQTREDAERDFLDDYYQSFLQLLYYRGKEVERRSDLMMTEFWLDADFIKSVDDLLRLEFIEKIKILDDAVPPSRKNKITLRRTFQTFAEKDYWREVFEEARRDLAPKKTK